MLSVVLMHMSMHDPCRCVNHSAHHDLEHSGEPAAGDVDEVDAPRDREAVMAKIQDAMARGGEYHVEYRLAGPAGERWVEGKGCVVLDAQGRPTLEARLGPAQAAPAPMSAHNGHADLVRRVLERGEPMAVNLSQAHEPPLRELLDRAGARSILMTPLLWGEKRLGVLEMVSSHRELGADWITFARAIGNQIGQALELAHTITRLNVASRRKHAAIGGYSHITSTLVVKPPTKTSGGPSPNVWYAIERPSLSAYCVLGISSMPTADGARRGVGAVTSATNR